ncbi:hypothetical protein K227x_14990 [Rubripirellula lacrimiformis]|uniref:Uncharacterized protein n=1 Tax=Rubripirellula lacrimiformis TaxID=1930273 RepID=A0A517N7Y6_9BACT|nr:hypothetical protein [Rubripirellula lacrimiformis]QDT03118.1 hypothetical protein K227x_14990 [Rubripirellula lacrimiformis]
MFRRFALMAALMAVPTFALAGEMVRYQCKEWKAKHIHDAKKADTISATLKKLGCELKQDQHNGHIDVKYRCPDWRELKLDSHDEAHKWEKWLKEYGFTTEHKH